MRRTHQHHMGSSGLVVTVSPTYHVVIPKQIRNRFCRVPRQKI
ncbi:MAG: hypothetical protein OXJ37_03800 [Bryobacterales bacterium]|nr:hypothetical protein [Bryobacterales bacterium]MDE0261510.1 hypothetical protein [Bryobacterales bacterium]MDE0620320.1 hypothetical protein [Bryobacterales bacterium]